MAKTHCVLCFCLVGILARAAAEEPTMSVRLTDAVTQAPIADAECTIVDPRTRTVRGRFKGESGTVRPVAGDWLVIYRQGYDLLTFTLPEEQRVIVAKMQPAKKCTLVVEGAGGEAVPLALTFIGSLPGEWRGKPVRAAHKVETDAARIEFPVARGLRTAVFIEAHRRLVWPFRLNVEPGGEYVLHAEKVRRLPMYLDQEIDFPSGRFEFLPDLMWQPSEALARIDAWRWFLTGPAWLRESFVERKETLLVCPDVPFHFAASFGEGRIYRYVDSETPALDLRGPHSLKSVAERPVVDGRLVASGSLLAPGRLDLFTIATYWDLRRSLEGCCVRVESDALAAWPAPKLPAADWLTVWHPDHGLAHLPWKPPRPLEGRTYPGKVFVEVDRRLQAAGFVSIFPVWKGLGDMRTMPPDEPLRRAFDGARRIIRFRGLPLAHYALNIRVKLTDRRTGRPVSCDTYREVTLSRKRPQHLLRLPP